MARGSIGTGVRAVGDEAALDDEVGVAHALLDVALDDRRVGGVVAVAHHAVGVAVGGPVDVHERRVGRQRGLEVVDDRQLLVLDLDQVDGLLRDLGRERRDGRDGVTLVAHVLLAEEVAILHEVAVEHVRHVGVGRDGEHAGERLRLGRVEPRDAAVRHAGELELRVQHAREVQVGRVAAGARDLVRAVCADEAPLGNGRQHCLLESLSERESQLASAAVRVEHLLHAALGEFAFEFVRDGLRNLLQGFRRALPIHSGASPRGRRRSQSHRGASRPRRSQP